MGVTKLLQVYEHSIRRGNIYEFYENVLAVDTSCFTYKGLYHNDYISYLSHYVNLFSRAKCSIYLVFDGTPPESKMLELESRAKSKTNKVDPHHWKYGKSITPDIILNIKKHL